MFQTFISRHNSNFFSDKLVLTSVTPASSAPVLQRSEERFSRNAETDLVCRLLLEKKKKPLGIFTTDWKPKPSGAHPTRRTTPINHATMETYLYLVPLS